MLTHAVNSLFSFKVEHFQKLRSFMTTCTRLIDFSPAIRPNGKHLQKVLNKAKMTTSAKSKKRPNNNIGQREKERPV